MQENYRKAMLQSWIDLSRFNMLSGSILVYWPFAWGLTMAARTVQMPLEHFLRLMVNGVFASYLSHSLGCIWNDILDRDFDAQVERTKNRPIASGKISVPAALGYIIIHIVILFSMIWKFDRLVWEIGVFSIFPLAALYPLMKRVTYWPQAWLGISINVGVAMSWAIAAGTYTKSCVTLGLATFFWTLWYDTIYACQDRKDDARAGVKSTALFFGKHVKQYLAVFGLFFAGLLTYSGATNNQSSYYYAISIGGVVAHLVWQLYTLNVDAPRDCFRVFKANAFYLGAIMETGLVIDYLSVI